jgi:hypothetical protein
MSTIEEIKQAVGQLSSNDLAEFRTWFAEFDWDVWDRQLEQDVAEGRLDALASEALRDLHQGRCTGL